MRRSIMLTATLTTLALAVHASDGGVELAMKSKALAASSSSAISISGTPAKQFQAPFTGVRDPLPELLLGEEQERRSTRGGCAGQDVCYDLAEGRIVYRGGRDFMPKVEGLKAESISLRAHRISFKYSF